MKKEKTDQNIIAFSQAIDRIVLKQLFPVMNNTLMENGPMQLFSLKLIDLIVSRNPQFVQFIKESEEITSCLTDFYSVKSQNMNRHTINLMKILIE